MKKNNEKEITAQIQMQNGEYIPVFGSVEIKNKAIVSLDVIMKLADLLPTANLQQIRMSFIEKLHDCTNFDGYLEAIQNELEFHLTVNQIKEYTPKPEYKEVEAVIGYQ